MHNCIFTAHCTEAFCDKSCPTLTETSYLLERNGITFSNPVFSASEDKVRKMLRILASAEGKFGVYRVASDENTIQSADLLTYCAICKHWKGSRLHCNVYNLKYSKYIDEMKQTWGGNAESENYQYMKIWSESAKVLIVSNFDYVNFGDFESQTLLNLIQTRQAAGLTTILVSPQIGTLVSSKKSTFFDILAKMMQNNIIKPLQGGGGDE
jgi:hypothetical protein